MKTILDRKDKRAYSIADMQGIVLLLVIIAVLFGAGLYATSQFKDKIVELEGVNASSLAIDNVTEGLSDLATWIPIIVVIIAAAIIIGIVIRSFGGGQRVA